MAKLHSNLFILLLLICTNIAAQPFQLNDLPSLLALAETDSNKKTERFAALHFHDLLNGYRIKEGFVVLSWSDTLWIANLNHCYWMQTDSRLSHGETKSNSYFTGEGMFDRYAFVLGAAKKVSAMAENALYNFSNSGENVTQRAERIAKHSLTQWQKSKGHNRNMLSATYHKHGIAFLGESNSTKIWSSSGFMRENQSGIRYTNP